LLNPNQQPVQAESKEVRVVLMAEQNLSELRRQVSIFKSLFFRPFSKATIYRYPDGVRSDDP
jgi:hypothetical protein